MKTQKSYWETKIIDWEKSAYSRKNILGKSFLDWLATPFRKILIKRFIVAEKLASSHIGGKIVLDLGCGSGLLLKRLARYKPKRLIGIDIAPSAIRLAEKRLKNSSLKIDLICADVRKETGFLIQADIIIGIGFIDYFSPQELLGLLKNIQNKYFLFSFPAKVFSLREIIQKIYLILARCPGFYKYSRSEMNSLLKKAGIKNWWYYDKEKIRFVTNLPH